MNERCVSPAVHRIDIGATIDEELDDLHVAVGSGHPRKRCSGMIVPDVDIGPVHDEIGYDVDVLVFRRGMQWAQTGQMSRTGKPLQEKRRVFRIGIPRVEPGSRLDEPPDLLKVSRFGGPVERCFAFGITDVGT
jgi:hypothetical protein